MIKKPILAALPIFLSGCSLFTYTESAVFVSGYLFGYEEDNISMDQYEAISASFANLKIGRGKSSTVVLAYIKEGIFEWRSSDNINIYTDNGFISKVTGLSSDINFSGTKILDNKFLGQEFESFVSFSEPFLYRSVMINMVEKTKEVAISTPNGPVITDLYIHKYNVPIIGWSGINKFYIDKNGFTIRAEQDLHPFLPRFKIDYFYKFE